MTRIRWRLALLLGLLVPALAARGQVTTGTPPFGSFSGGPFDTVNNANLNVHLSVPVITKAGRGLPFTYTLSYDSSLWYPVGAVGSQTWTPVANWGWRGVTEVVTGYVTYNSRQGSCFDKFGQQHFYTNYSNWVYHDSFGSTHAVSLVVSDAASDLCPNGPPSSATGTVTDGSGYTMTVYSPPGATVYSAGGQKIIPPLQAPSGSATATDRNGNQITASGSTGTTFTDTLGTTGLTVSGSGTAASPRNFTYTNPLGGSSSFVMNYTTKSVKTSFGCSGISDYGPTNMDLVTRIDLPDGTSYQITYEPTPGDSTKVTGRIASITLPTGGTITYTYTGGSSGHITCADGTAATLTRQTPDGSWTYAHAESGTAWTTTISDPQSNSTIVNFQTIYETQRQIKDPAGSVLVTVDTCYNGATIPCTGTAVALPISNRTVQTTLGSLVAKTYTTYDAYGLPTEVDGYTWGPTLVRKTLITYNRTLGNNIVDRPSSIVVQDSTSATKASTTFGYDQTAVTATSGTPQHVAISGSRGNATTVTFTTQGTSTISRTFTYFDTGIAQTATDVNAAQTNFAYNSTGCANSLLTGVTMPLSLSRSQVWNCTGGVVTSATDENSQTTNFDYTDANFWRLSDFKLPPVPPPNGPRGWTLFKYTSATQLDTYVGLTDTTPSDACTGCRHDKSTLDALGRVIQSSLVNDPEGQTYVDSTYDSLGRVASVTNPYRTGSSFGSENYAYDPLNRLTTITHADTNTVQVSYGSGAQSCASGTYGVGYPALVTDEAAHQRQAFTDALGRVIELDEPDPASGNSLTLSTCYLYDALDNLTQVVQGSQTRNYTFDALSRLTGAQTPEGNNVWTYFYYTNSGGGLCSGDPNALCRRTDARNITTTFAYDALNRPISKTYSDSTPGSNLFYDQAPASWPAWTGVTFANPKGRLVLACTNSPAGTCSSPQTAVAYSYDAAGRIADFWQCTPFNCSNATIWNTHYASYNLAGDVTQWTHPSNFTLTNSVNNAQRVAQLQSSLVDTTHPQNLADSITYWPFGVIKTLLNGCTGTGCTQRQEKYDYNNRLQPVMIQLGTSATPNANSCTVYNYYSGVANPTSCTTPTQAGTGNNGNAAGYFYQDSSYPTLGHTASFTYDSLDRLATAAATGSSTYNLTYGYDRWGNVTCTGGTGLCTSISYDPANNNRISTIGSSAVTYDAAGDLTSDGTGTGSQTYHWDAEGRMTQAAINSGPTTTYVYNALGQRVEKNVAGAYTEILYDAFGNVMAYHNRTTWVQLFVPPVGGRFFMKYQDSVTYFLHTNLLGSSGTITNQAGDVENFRVSS